MRTGLIAATAAAFLIFSASALADPPDEAFSAAHEQWMSAKAAELLAPYKGQQTTAQNTEAWCRAAYMWKLANPGGEAKLTLKVLLQFRRLQWLCGQKIKRAPPLPSEDDDGTPPPTPPTRSDPNDESQGGDGAVEDFMRWHPDEFNNPAGLTEEDYIRRRLFWWEWVGGHGEDLEEAARAAKKALDEFAGKDHPEMSPEAEKQTKEALEKELAEAERKAGEARDAEIAKARAEWAAGHPGEDGDYDGDLGWTPGPDEGAGRNYRSGAGVWQWDEGLDAAGPFAIPFDQLTPEQRQKHYEWEDRTADGSVDPLAGVVADRTADGSVDPLDAVNAENRSATGSVDPLGPAWANAVQPIVVGPNSQVGSGARVRDQVVGAIAGALGVRGGDDSGPSVENCRFDTDEMQAFGDPQSGVSMKVAARRNGDTVTVCSQVEQSPDQGTFQAAYLQDPQGQQQAPRDVDICRLYGQWRLSVGWTRSTYTNGALTSRETGGWTRQGSAMIPGMSPGSDAIWKRLGFSNASRGAQMARFRFTAPRQQMGPNGMGVVIHITRPGQDPVTTAPFAMVMREGPEGFTFERPGQAPRP